MPGVFLLGGVMKDLLSDRKFQARLARECGGPEMDRAADFRALAVNQSIADLRYDRSYLTARPLLSAEFAELAGRRSVLETRSLLAAETQKSGRIVRFVSWLTGGGKWRS